MLSISVTGTAAATDDKTTDTTKQHPIRQPARMCEMGSQELDGLLPDLQHRLPVFKKRLQAICEMYTGCGPYCNDPLPDETKNWFPYQKTNCTMFVLYTAALTNSTSFNEALCHMRLLHYRNGEVHFKNRYHFTTDRISDPANSYFTACTEQFSADSAYLKKKTLTLNKKTDGSFLFDGKLGGWFKTLTIHYMPREGFTMGRLKPLPGVVGIAFVKKSNWDIGVLVGHEGILANGDLYHSSPGKGVNVQKNYLQTVFPDSDWEGFILFKINQVPLPSEYK